MLTSDSKGIQKFILNQLIQIHDEIIIHDPKFRELGEQVDGRKKQIAAKLAPEDEELLEDYEGSWLAQTNRQDENERRRCAVLSEDISSSAAPPLKRWDAINWRKLTKGVWRVQQRIYRAESQGNKRLVRNLQRLLVRSRAARLLFIRRVTQVNKGKRTAGVDGYTALTPQERVKLYNHMENISVMRHKPKPAKGPIYPRNRENCAHWESRLLSTECWKTWLLWLWNHSGRLGLSQSHMVSDRSGALMMPLRQSS